MPVLSLQPCKSKGGSIGPFSIRGPSLIPAMVWSGGKTAVIFMIASSQVNASLCSLLYALNEQLTSTNFSRLSGADPENSERGNRVTNRSRLNENFTLQELERTALLAYSWCKVK